MKNLLLKIVPILFLIGMIQSQAVPALAAHGVSEIVSVPGLLLLMYGIYQIPTPKHMLDPNIYAMGVQKEIWQDHIEGNLFKDNEFLLRSVDASEYIMENGKTVHIPQAGATPSIVKNRSTFPATASQRTDTDVTYDLDNYSSDPIHIAKAEERELSYDKRETVLAEHESTLRERFADELLRIWSPSNAANIIRTTGAATLAHLDSATGNRKKFALADLKAAQLKLDKMKVSKVGRVALFSADMYQQFTDELTVNDKRDFSASYNPETGVIGKLYGFDIMMRADVVQYDNTATPVLKAYGASAATTDNDAVLCWYDKGVERAVGSVEFFDDERNPLYYGDVYSFSVTVGGRKRRADQKGTLAIVQAASA